MKVDDSFTTRWKWLIALPSDKKMADCFTTRWKWLTALLPDESSRLLHHQIKVVFVLSSDESGDCFIIRWKWSIALPPDESGGYFIIRWKWLSMKSGRMLYHQMKVAESLLSDESGQNRFNAK